MNSGLLILECIVLGSCFVPVASGPVSGGKPEGPLKKPTEGALKKQ
jgi:hypothetical protein